MSADPDWQMVVDAKAGNPEALEQLWIGAEKTARRVAEKTVRKYDWLDADDIVPWLLCRLIKVLDRYDAGHDSKTVWSKYLFWRFSFLSKDYCRQWDPVGLHWPQKKRYCEWSYLAGMAQDYSQLLAGDGRNSDLFGDELPEVELDDDDDNELTNADIRDVLDEIAPRIRGRRRPKPKQIKPRKPSKRKPKKWSRHWARINRLREGTLANFMSKKGEAMIPASNEPKPAPEAPAPAPEAQPSSEWLTPARKASLEKRKKAASAGKKKAKRKRPTKSVAPDASMSADRLLALAVKLSEACGGIGKAKKLLEQLEAVRK